MPYPRGSLGACQRVPAAALASNSNLACAPCRLRRGVSHPLVLAFTGSTGVGKTATATALAAALLGAALPAGRDAASTLRGRPGLLQLSGSDYGDGAAVAVPVLRRRLRHALAQLLYECHGTGVVVLDEAQKMNPAVLEGER